MDFLSWIEILLGLINQLFSFLEICIEYISLKNMDGIYRQCTRLYTTSCKLLIIRVNITGAQKRMTQKRGLLAYTNEMVISQWTESSFSSVKTSNVEDFNI